MMITMMTTMMTTMMITMTIIMTTIMTITKTTKIKIRINNLQVIHLMSTIKEMDKTMEIWQ